MQEKANFETQAFDLLSIGVTKGTQKIIKTTQPEAQS
jgi:hypothetical protein